ncbi:hypothetical protein C8Q80DRAFT_680794 [Daedaleopsis nitida]|nr:hypothetical protein C8Q80DRAFT_680794 [Daedaleopsis nitida]
METLDDYATRCTITTHDLSRHFTTSNAPSPNLWLLFARRSLLPIFYRLSSLSQCFRAVHPAFSTTHSFFLPPTAAIGSLVTHSHLWVMLSPSSLSHPPSCFPIVAV